MSHQPSGICHHDDHFCEWRSPPKWLLLSVQFHILGSLVTLVVLLRIFRHNIGDWAGFDALRVSNAPFWLMAWQCARSPHHWLLPCPNFIKSWLIHHINGRFWVWVALWGGHLPNCCISQKILCFQFCATCLVQPNVRTYAQTLQKAG